MKIKVGIDEAGRGPRLGPVVASAFAFGPEFDDKLLLSELNDSKKLSEKKREEIFEKLISMSSPLPKGEGLGVRCFFGVGVVDNYIIDDINIRQANKEAMRRAIVEILRKIPHPSPLFGGEKTKIEVLIDGRDNYTFEELDKKPIYIIGGDAKVPEISAASIIAKVFRDKLMTSYSSLYPDMHLDKHKGYGTKAHKEYLSDKSKITGIHRLSYKPVKEKLLEKPKLLLHVCCGPDATVPIIDLKDQFDLLCYWYDPNIQPKKEYDKRLKEFKKVCEIEKIPFIEGLYDVENFFHKIKGLEQTPERGEKCTKCYDMRLESSAKLAKEMKIPYFTSTLTISPHKDLKKLFCLGESQAKKYGVEFLKFDFKKNDGFLRSIKYCEKNNILRQDYCGCIFSKKK